MKPLVICRLRLCIAGVWLWMSVVHLLATYSLILVIDFYAIVFIDATRRGKATICSSTLARLELTVAVASDKNMSYAHVHVLLIVDIVCMRYIHAPNLASFHMHTHIQARKPEPHSCLW